MFKKHNNQSDKVDNVEKKVFKIILIVAIVMPVINLILNLLIGFHLLINLKWIFMTLLAAFILKAIQKDLIDFFYLKFSFFLFIIFFFVPLAWFQSGGSENNGIAYIFLILISISFLFKKKKIRNFFVLSLVAVFMIIFTAEYFYPQLLFSYSEQIQFLDRLLQTPIVLLASYLLLLQFARAYNQEKSKLGLSTKKLRLANEKLQELANRDPLTQQYNRRAFDQEIRNIFKHNQHQQTDITLILFDIDNFKKINDSYGHDIGDQVLIELSNQLEAIMPESTLISRWGGDEFAVICHKSEIETQKYLDDYYQSVEALSEKLEISITVSAGLSRLKADDEIKELFKRVDDILYKSKEEGKDRYTVA